jgi:hypothetical protein
MLQDLVGSGNQTVGSAVGSPGPDPAASLRWRFAPRLANPTTVCGCWCALNSSSGLTHEAS